MAKRRKIAILGALSDLNPAYSIAQVALDQLFMLKEAGEDVVFVTTEEFQSEHLLPDGVEVRRFPRMQGYKENDVDLAAFDQFVFEAAACLRVVLADVTHCLTHDVLFLRGFLWVGWALRHAARDLPKLKFYHWAHSGPSKRPDKIEYPLSSCYMPMENSIYCYPNRTDIPRVAEMFGCPEAHVQCVYNTVDMARLLDFTPVTRHIIKEYDLYSADVVCVYPTRMSGAKQPDKVVRVLGALKSLGQDVRLIFCNSWSNNEEQRVFIKELHDLGSQWGLTDREIVFTSQLEFKADFDIQLGIPKRSVMELLQVADLFILPSISETASLIMLEAALTKNLIVVNEDLLCMREFAGQKIDLKGSTRAIYAEFGSITRPVTGFNPDEWTWYQHLAKNILEVQEADKALQYFKYVRKYHSPSRVWTSQLRSLLT